MQLSEVRTIMTLFTQGRQLFQTNSLVYITKHFHLPKTMFWIAKAMIAKGKFSVKNGLKTFWAFKILCFGCLPNVLCPMQSVR